MKEELIEITRNEYQHLNDSKDLLSYIEEFLDAVEEQSAKFHFKLRIAH